MELVRHNFPGASIKGDDVLCLGAGGDGCEISNPANVLDNPPGTAVAKEQVIEKGNQRRALSAGGHVRRAKIRDHGYTQPGRDRRALPALPAPCDRLPPIRRSSTLRG